VICYAWFTQSTDVITAGAEERLLSPELRNRFRQEVHRLSRNVPTRDHRRGGIEETLLRVILRGLPKDEEIHRILSVISESADAFEEE
jgi:tRNA C32,U32 (ribose-2'-O)-methylase TrmJ